MGCPPPLQVILLTNLCENAVITPTIGEHGEHASFKLLGDDTNGVGLRSFVAKRKTNTCRKPCKAATRQLTKSALGQQSLLGNLPRTPCEEFNVYEACMQLSLRASQTSQNLLSLTSLLNDDNLFVYCQWHKPYTPQQNRSPHPSLEDFELIQFVMSRWL